MIEKMFEYALEKAVAGVIVNWPESNLSREMCWQFMTALF
jgi:hypothetical protein